MATEQASLATPVLANIGEVSISHNSKRRERLREKKREVAIIAKKV